MNANHHTESIRQCDVIQELIPDYAFGLTDAEETRLVESNLAYCPDAAAQLADFQRLQDELRLTVPQIDPPMRLREKLMTATTTPVIVPKSGRRQLPVAWLVAA